MSFSLYLVTLYFISVVYGILAFLYINYKFRKYLKTNYTKDIFTVIKKRILKDKDGMRQTVILIVIPIINIIAVTQTLSSYEKQKEKVLNKIRKELFNMQTE